MNEVGNDSTMARKLLMHLLSNQDQQPAWMSRALDPSTPMTEQGETIRSASSEIDGGEALYPTIRQNPDTGELNRSSMGEAYDMAVMLKDYIQTQSPEMATYLSKMLSGEIGQRRSNPDSLMVERRGPNFE